MHKLLFIGSLILCCCAVPEWNSNDAEFFVVEYDADPAAMDAKSPGVWKRLEEAVGEERSKQLQNDFINSVDEMWSYLYAQLPDLSHTAENSGTAQE